MSTWRILVTVLLLIHPVLSQHITTTCEIPSVEAGENVTLTVHFGQDLRQEEIRDFSLEHIGHSSTASQTRLLDCEFAYGNVTCHKTSCCTWESHVTDVFRVYIHNVSQDLEGRFWGFVIPASTEYQKSCNFSLKAFSCLTDSINATNSHMTCSNQSVTLCQTCTVTCNPGYHFKENHNSVTYTCVGKKKWFPENPLTSCEAYTCPTDFISASNSEMKCSRQPVTIGETCRVTCNPGHYFKENQISRTYKCVEKNKWSPETPVTSCEAYTCPTDFINASNSEMKCSRQPVTIGETCIVTCNPGRYFKENQTSRTYKCVEKNKWSPETPVTSCEGKGQEESNSRIGTGIGIGIGIAIVIAIVIGIVFILYKRKRRQKQKKELLLFQRTREGEINWLECIRKWYPYLQSRTYFLPPLHFNRALCSQPSVSGNLPPMLQTPQDCDGRDDRALKRVLLCLHALAHNSRQADNSQETDNLQETDKLLQANNPQETDKRQQADNSQQAHNPQQKEVMMIISQLQFGKYIGQPSYAGTVSLLPLYSKLSGLSQQHYHKGHCDVLIIHKTLGPLTLQITSVGENFSQLEMTEQEQDDVVMNKVKESVKHLNKAEADLKHLTSDIADIKHITKILVLPNISSNQLLRAINRFPSDAKLLCECLGAKSVDDALKLCLLKDQLSDNQTPSNINPSSIQALREWWQLIRASRSGSLLTSSLYEQLVARFCGSATTVEVHCVTAPRLNVRTLGEAVSETGERVARLVLFPQQVDILNRSPPRAFLSGPPGTGKTIVLIMQGLTWIHRGYDVHVVSTWYDSRAVTFVIEYQLQETSSARSRVHRHQFDLRKDREVKIAVSCLKSQSEGRQLCVIADEAMRGYDRKSFTEFYDQLINEVPGVFIWSASLYHEVRPLCLEEVKLTTPFRSPPVVVREVMEARQIKNEQVHNYTVSDVPVPTDGPPVIRIEHCYGQSGHTGSLPQDCVKCGHQVARVLTELDVGRTGDSNGPPPLQYRDVLVLCYGCPTNDRVDSNGQLTRTASGLVRGLRDRHVPVRVVEKGDEAAIRDMALGVSDLVTVADWLDVQGLERKVVVVESGFDVSNRLYAMSCCTSQLVLIDWIPVDVFTTTMIASTRTRITITDKRFKNKSF